MRSGNTSPQAGLLNPTLPTGGWPWGFGRWLDAPSRAVWGVRGEARRGPAGAHAGVLEMPRKSLHTWQLETTEMCVLSDLEALWGGGGPRSLPVSQLVSGEFPGLWQLNSHLSPSSQGLLKATPSPAPAGVSSAFLCLQGHSPWV